MLDAMESNAKGKDNFAIKIISMENVEGKNYIFKNNIRSKKKESNLFFPFFKLLSWATSFKVIFSGLVLYF